MPCSVTISPIDAVAAILASDDDNTTIIGNVTKHCSKTEFKCCPDWYTPAEGKDYKGCPTFVLGAFLKVFFVKKY